MASSSIEELVAGALERFAALADPVLAQRVQVVWNGRMRSTAGRAFWPEARVELNPKLVEISHEEVRRTLLHELAHLLAYARSRGRRIAPHGVEWQRACADLGIAGESVRHSLPLPRRVQRRKWRYACPSCGVAVERVREVKGAVACMVCCRKYNGGRYSARFRLVAERL